ncbi:calcium-binding protein [Gemmobacter fulva]|nr:hypothetical protein [Gemmobacter fulvus]
MDVIFESRDITPQVRITRDAAGAVTVTVDYQTNGWYDEELGYYLYDYGGAEITFGGITDYAYVGGDDDGVIFATVTATVLPEASMLAEVLFRIDNIDPFGTVFPIEIAVLDVAGSLTGGTGIDAMFGSAFNDTLAGGDGDDALEGGVAFDRLDGGSGNDNMLGGANGDVYVVDSYGDRVDESVLGSFGRDTVETHLNFRLSGPQVMGWVERLVLTGSDDVDGIGNRRHNQLIGNEGDNHLEGRAGDDRLRGGLGADTLSGGEGADRFVFHSALGGDNIDKILDFEKGVDVIALDNAVMSTLRNPGQVLASTLFTANADGVAQDSDDRIIHETDTGLLRYDADGSGAGAAIIFARVTPGQILSAADFLVV